MTNRQLLEDVGCQITSRCELPSEMCILINNQIIPPVYNSVRRQICDPVYEVVWSQVRAELVRQTQGHL